MVLYPGAMAKFHIPHLSTDHGGRLFKLCITGAGRFVEPLSTGGKDFETVIFSAPFEVVSKMPVVANASKRKTREQLREQKRAKPGPGSVA